MKLSRLFVVLMMIALCNISCNFYFGENGKKLNFSEVEKIEKNQNELILYPPTSTANQIIIHKYFSLSYSEEDEQAEWVAYKIISNDFNKNVGRTNDFRIDPYVSTYSADLKDYKGSGYDRGHLAPAASMSQNTSSMSESFYMSNISPQVPEFNRGIWKRLEGKVRYWAAMNDSLYVVTGPILDNPIDSIGKNSVTVPRAFYKSVLRFKNGDAKGIAFLIPNEKSEAPIYNYAISIDSIELLTDINFYHNMDSIIQLKVESNKSIKAFILKY